MDKNWNKNLKERLTMLPAPTGALYQLGRQGSWTQDSGVLREKKRMLTGTSTSCVSILVPDIGCSFEESAILPYFQVLPLLSVSSCIFLRVAWNRLCESQCSGRVAAYIFILARRMKEYVFWSDLQVFLLAFSAQLSKTEKLYSAISNTTVFQCFFLHLQIFIFVALIIKSNNNMGQCA